MLISERVLRNMRSNMGTVQNLCAVLPIAICYPQGSIGLQVRRSACQQVFRSAGVQLHMRSYVQVFVC